MPKYQLIYTAKARRDLVEVVENVVDYTCSLESGVRLFSALRSKIALLADMPEGIGRVRDDGKREAFCRGYRIVYRIEKDTVYILTILHSRMLYPRS